jgi:DNA polymerase III sliding clamp (beta) subunit (PCNA family)
VLPAVANRSGLRILSGVRLEDLDDGLVIEATDLELTARRLVREDVTVDAAGSVVVPAKALAKAVAAMAEPEIALESALNDGRGALDVRAGTRTVTLQGWATDDWPAAQRVAERWTAPGSDTCRGPSAQPWVEGSAVSLRSRKWWPDKSS